MKSIDTKIAEQNVDASIAQFETAVNHLIDKVESTTNTVNDAIDTAKETYEIAVEKYEHTMETLHKPVLLAKDLADRATFYANDLRERIRLNPEPYISGAGLAFGLFLCYRAVRRHQRFTAMSNQHSWTQQEP